MKQQPDGTDYAGGERKPPAHIDAVVPERKSCRKRNLAACLPPAPLEWDKRWVGVPSVQQINDDENFRGPIANIGKTINKSSATCRTVTRQLASTALRFVRPSQQTNQHRPFSGAEPIPPAGEITDKATHRQHRFDTGRIRQGLSFQVSRSTPLPATRSLVGVVITAE